MSSFRRSTFFALPVFVNDKGEKTFNPYSLVEEINEDGTKVKSMKPNERAKDSSGEDSVKPMNRYSRRLLESKKRRKR